MVTPTHDSSDNSRDKELLDLLVADWHAGDHGDARMMTDNGFHALRVGLFDLAHECFTLALPQLLEDLGPNGPEETEDTFVPMSGPRIEPGGSVSQKITWGWSAEMKADWWICVGLCRWVLENRHDDESFTNAGDCLYRWCSPIAERQVHTEGLCAYAPRFIAARQYDRALELFRAAPKFKPPRTPGNARTQRAMAYALCLRHEGTWTSDQIQKAWTHFFPAIVHSVSEHHYGLGVNRALWIKMRYWDDPTSATKPEATTVYAEFMTEDERLTRAAEDKLKEAAKKDPRLAREIARQKRFYEQVVENAKKPPRQPPSEGEKVSG